MAIRSKDPAGSADAVITADGLTKRYGHVLALDGLQLSIGRGEAYGFLGPNSPRASGGAAGALLLIGAVAAATACVLFTRRDLRSG